MPLELGPIRRVVTGSDAQGRSTVLHDGAAPNVAHFPDDPNRINTNIWIWDRVPIPLTSERDDGDMPYVFPGPPAGGHLRVVQAKASPGGEPPHAKHGGGGALHQPAPRRGGRAWDRGGKDAYSSAMHKTQSVDYGIVLAGGRDLVLDDCTLVMKPGDVVIQVGAWHKWESARRGCRMAFDMIAAEFVDGPAGIAQGANPVVSPKPDLILPQGVRPPRRIVTIDREPGRSSLVSDGPAPDVRLDPARPGYAAFRLWVTDRTPANIVEESLHLPHTLEPPSGGSVLRVVTYPPDEAWTGRVGAKEVEAFFESLGSPGAPAYSAGAPHPYMQATGSLDFCLVLEGETLLVLDTGEVPLIAGDIAVVRGGRHAFSNRSSQPCTVAVASHDGAP